MRDCVLVFIDGTICDLTHRHHLKGTPDFEKEDIMMLDTPVGDGVICMNELYERYDLVYIGARSENTVGITDKWLKKNGFPDGKVVVGSSQKNRLSIVKELKKQLDFIAGIGDRWDDNELHLELGCTSIILEEYDCNWDTVRKYLLNNPAKLTHISIITKDVKRLSDFYEAILKVKDKFVAGNDYVELKTTSCVIAVESVASLERRANAPFGSNVGNNILFEFKVDNADEDYFRLEKLGVDIVKPLTDSSWGTRTFYFRDPDGNLVDFFSEIKKNWGV